MKYLIFASVLLLAAICFAQPIVQKNENQNNSRDKRHLLLGLGLAKGAALIGGIGAAKVIGAGAIGAGIIGAGALHKLKYAGDYGYGHGYGGYGGYHGGYHGGYYPIKKSYIIEEPYEEVYVRPSVAVYPEYSSYPSYGSHSNSGSFATAGSFSGGYSPSFSSASAYASSGSW